jgi:hypothetical protein
MNDQAFRDRTKRLASNVIQALSPSLLSRQRLCRKFKYLPVRPEYVEGLRANCDTVSQGRGSKEFLKWQFSV